MALFLFTKAILNSEPIKVFNHGRMTRDFTYIDDIVESIIRLIEKPPSSDKDFDTSNPRTDRSWAPHRIFNIGNNQSIELLDYIHEIEKNLGLKADKNLLSLQPGDVEDTFANVEDLSKVYGFKPETSIVKGVKQFIEWYKDYHKIK